MRNLIFYFAMALFTGFAGLSLLTHWKVFWFDELQKGLQQEKRNIAKTGNRLRYWTGKKALRYRGRIKNK